MTVRIWHSNFKSKKVCEHSNYKNNLEYPAFIAFKVVVSFPREMLYACYQSFLCGLEQLIYQSPSWALSFKATPVHNSLKASILSVPSLEQPSLPPLSALGCFSGWDGFSQLRQHNLSEMLSVAAFSVTKHTRVSEGTPASFIVPILRPFYSNSLFIMLLISLLLMAKGPHKEQKNFLS